MYVAYTLILILNSLRLLRFEPTSAPLESDREQDEESP